MGRQKSIPRKVIFILIVFFLATSINGQAIAGTLNFNYDYVFSGMNPAGPTPYLTSTFDDTAATTTDYDVRLTIFAENLDPGHESITKLYFNLDPTLDASLLTFTAIDNSNAEPNSVTGIDNNYKADGDGL